jgi:outer membrane murein-binding lipoprotein Lpp
VINLRYHIVSIVAVFLALGIGLALGSTFISGAVVSRLEDDIDDLRAERADLQAEVDRLDAELDAVVESQEQFEQAALPIIAGGRLDGSRLVVLAVEGVDPEVVDEIEIGLAGSAGEFAGTLWITDRFAIDDDADRSDLATVLDAAAGTDLQGTLETRLAGALAPAEPIDTAVVLGSVLNEVTGELLQDDALAVAAPVEPATRPLVADLVDAGFLRLDEDASALGDVDPEDLIVHGTRYIVVSGEGAVVPDSQVVLPVLRAMAAAPEPVPAIATDSSPVVIDGTTPAFIEAIRSDPVLSTAVSTVDNVIEFSGLLAAYTALDQIPFVGHYGVGAEAQSLLPPPL